MNKREARKQAMNNTKTFAEFLTLINTCKAGNVKSKLNPSLSKLQVQGIFRLAVKGRNQSEIPKGSRLNFVKNRTEMSSDGLTIYNILREFG